MPAISSDTLPRRLCGRPRAITVAMPKNITRSVAG
jgi:hypothetical protein